MFELFTSFLVIVYGILWIVNKLGGKSISKRESHSYEDPGEVFPNEHAKSEYHEKQFTNTDISTWGLDQNAAPRPDIARKMILDSLDGYLGEKKDRSDRDSNDLNMFND